MYYKLGDVIQLKEDLFGLHKKGDKFTVVPDSEMGIWWIQEGKIRQRSDDGDRYKDKFELAFDLFLSPWKIRTGSKEKSALVQQYLFDRGIHWESHRDVQKFNEKFLTNLSVFQYTQPYIMHSSSDFETANATEIILEFETVVKSVQYVSQEVKKTEAQLQLETLMNKIDELSKEAETLKSIIDKGAK